MTQTKAGVGTTVQRHTSYGIHATVGMVSGPNYTWYGTMKSRRLHSHKVRNNNKNTTVMACIALYDKTTQLNWCTDGAVSSTPSQCSPQHACAQVEQPRFAAGTCSPKTTSTHQLGAVAQQLFHTPVPYQESARGNWYHTYYADSKVRRSRAPFLPGLPQSVDTPLSMHNSHTYPLSAHEHTRTSFIK